MKKAMALVSVLWIVMLLSAVVAMMVKASLINGRVVLSHSQQSRCSWAARAGVEKAIAVLLSDENQSDSFEDVWHDNVEDFNDIDINECLLTVEVIDESSKLSLNRSTRKQLMELPDAEGEFADCVLDWRDKNDTVREEGAEDDYYTRLDVPYYARNAAFKTTMEVLFVKGVDESIFYGQLVDNSSKQTQDSEIMIEEQTEPAVEKGVGEFITCFSGARNKDKDGNNRINVNRANENSLAKQLGISTQQAKWIKQQMAAGRGKLSSPITDSKDAGNKNNNQKQQGNQKDQAQPIDIETFKKIADKLTGTNNKFTNGLVNVNTASLEVLTALLEGDEVMADQIIKYRSGLEEPMSSVADVMNVSTMTTEKFKKIVDHITVRSDVFAVRCSVKALATGMVYKSEAVVKRMDQGCQLLYWYEGAAN